MRARSQIVQRLFAALRHAETGEYRSVMAEMRQQLREGLSEDATQDVLDALIDAACAPVYVAPLVEMGGR